MSIGINILRPERGRDSCERFCIKDRGSVYVGQNPFTVVKGENDVMWTARPWVIAHPDCEGFLYKCLAVENFCLLEIGAGKPIGILVREWDDAIDGKPPI